MPKAQPLERSLLASTLRKLKALRAQDKSLVYRKRHGTAMGIAGDPDLYGLWHGWHWELELKAPGEKPTLLQHARHREWSAAGAIVAIADSPGMVDVFISRLRALCALPRDS